MDALNVEKMYLGIAQQSKHQVWFHMPLPRTA